MKVSLTPTGLTVRRAGVEEPLVDGKFAFPIEAMSLDESELEWEMGEMSKGEMLFSTEDERERNIDVAFHGRLERKGF